MDEKHSVFVLENWVRKVLKKTLIKAIELQRASPSSLGTSVLGLGSSCVDCAHVDRVLLEHIRVAVRVE